MAMRLSPLSFFGLLGRGSFMALKAAPVTREMQAYRQQND
jgi:hypothetical protein